MSLTARRARRNLPARADELGAHAGDGRRHEVVPSGGHDPRTDEIAGRNLTGVAVRQVDHGIDVGRLAFEAALQDQRVVWRRAIDEQVDVWAFLFHQLGVHYRSKLAKP